MLFDETMKLLRSDGAKNKSISLFVTDTALYLSRQQNDFNYFTNLPQNGQCYVPCRGLYRVAKKVQYNYLN